MKEANNYISPTPIFANFVWKTCSITKKAHDELQLLFNSIQIFHIMCRLRRIKTSTHFKPSVTRVKVELLLVACRKLMLNIKTTKSQTHKFLCKETYAFLYLVHPGYGTFCKVRDLTHQHQLWLWNYNGHY